MDKIYHSFISNDHCNQCKTVERDNDCISLYGMFSDSSDCPNTIDEKIRIEKIFNNAAIKIAEKIEGLCSSNLEKSHI